MTDKEIIICLKELIEQLKETKMSNTIEQKLKQLRCYENHGGNFALWADLKILADCIKNLAELAKGNNEIRRNDMKHPKPFIDWDQLFNKYKKLETENEQLQATILERGKGMIDRDAIIGKLKQENERLKENIDSFDKEKQERERVTIMNMPTLHQAIQQAAKQKHYGMLKISQEYLERLCKENAENEKLKEENKQLQATILERGKGITDRDTIIGKLKQEIIQMKTQMFPNEYEQDSLDAMDERKAIKRKENCTDSE